jgi:diadenylate cyclase
MVDLLWYLQRLGWIDVVDILLVAFIFFWLLYLVRGTRAVPLLRGVIFLVIAGILLGGVIQLRAFGWSAKRGCRSSWRVAFTSTPTYRTSCC